MLNYIISRIFSAFIVIFGVVFIVFMLIHMVPGDPVEVMLGESATAIDREALRHSLGLDKPLWQQFAHFLHGLINFDLGHSLHSKKPITELISARIGPTVELTLASLLVAFIIAFPLGVLAALNKDKFADAGAMSFSLLGVSIPNFLMGPLLILFFSVFLGWFPVSGKSDFSSLILPALTLGTALAAVLSRMIRASLLEILNEDYIRTAKAKGLSRTRIIVIHALRNALLPVITLIGLQIGALLAGAVITEIVFSWPGLGQLTIEAIQKRDYPVVQVCILLISTSYVVVNTLTDIVYGLLDPRIRLA
ncbi:MAG: ABC transporter permease [gamma proteobacterium symbiont of Bathyaustriella thionipta]|nr:ABC transporter permease [gamma proteobacterium symbiont of Bathyaustriella thionipta]MCU7949853.1 ABC transporter permease [gamma proteobacterium symbiont of Bathyaustriella thionipta]MCU7954611.1 ABC transporter permease [gamma proteobacterium symbiont of Bathyaustriella thionipta]MCU7956544.1 ABC transporter permease [gamma proteobacterium symbiont of Bathyaustriella thionipta]MCU7967006.1 ABC transporter permease [gamma proteobacterium symbiont of Bathyaustriella thionipta]